MIRAVVPGTMLQSKQRFQPVVEQFGGVAAPGVGLLPMAALRERRALLASLALLPDPSRSRLLQGPLAPLLGDRRILWPGRTFARAISLLVSLDAFPILVVVIRPVGQGIDRLAPQAAGGYAVFAETVIWGGFGVVPLAPTDHNRHSGQPIRNSRFPRGLVLADWLSTFRNLGKAIFAKGAKGAASLAGLAILPCCV